MTEHKIKTVFQERLEDLVFNKKKQTGLTQNQIADSIGIATSALSNYLNSDREAGIVTLYKIAKYFDVTTDYLLGLEEAPDHIEADICRETGLDKNAALELRMWSRLAFVEKRDVQAGFNSLCLEAVNQLITKCPQILYEIAIYLFTDIADIDEINFMRDNAIIGVLNNKKYVLAGILTSINEELSKERDYIQGNAVREEDLPQKPPASEEITERNKLLFKAIEDCENGVFQISKDE